MIIFTPDQRRQVIVFLKRGEDGRRYSVGQDGNFYGDFGSGPVVVPDETMIDTALARAGLVFEQGMVEQGLVSMYGINSDISSQYILLETMPRVKRVLLINMADQFEMAWFRIFSYSEGDPLEADHL